MFPSDRNNGASSDSSAANQQLSIVTIALDRETQRLLKLWLPTASIREMTDYPDDNSFLEWIGPSGLDVCLIDFDKDSSKAFNMFIRFYCVRNQLEPAVANAMADKTGNRLIP